MKKALKRKGELKALLFSECYREIIVRKDGSWLSFGSGEIVFIVKHKENQNVSSKDTKELIKKIEEILAGGGEK